MSTAIKFLNMAGERWMDGARSGIHTQLVTIFTPFGDGKMLSCLTQREFEHKIIFVFEMRIPL